MFSGQFYEMKLSVRERNMKLLPETVTYIAIRERVTCIITIEAVTCIMHCKNTTCIIATDSHLHNYSKNCHTYICCRNCHLHTINGKYHLKTCINATDVVTCCHLLVTIKKLKVTSATKEILKMCHLRRRLRIFYFMFLSQDSQVFVFLTISRSTKSVT